MIPIEREKRMLDKSRLEGDLKAVRGQLAELEERKAAYNADIYERDKALFEKRIQIAEKALAEISKELASDS